MVSSMTIIGRLIMAALLGGVIGFERELHRRQAGLRTNILVCLGSCLIMLTSIHLFDIYKNIAAIDPARLAAGVITGIGFLGAGTIIRYGRDVKGLTTAASLWVVAAIGLGVGCGFYLASFFTTILAVVILFFFRFFEEIIFKETR